MTIQEFEILLPSELLQTALNDLEAIEKNTAYCVDMNHYHIILGGRCHVCFAGCVLANTLQLKPDVSIGQPALDFANMYSYNISQKLFALNEFRNGVIDEFSMYFPTPIQRKIDKTYYDGKLAKYAATYESDPELFKQWVRDIIANFKELKL